MKPDILPTEYLEFYGNKRTRKTYLASLRGYLSIVTKTPVEEIGDLDQAYINYLDNPENNPSRDLMNFVKSCRKLERKLSPLTMASYMDTGERYLKECCNIELTAQQKRLRKKDMPKRRPITEDAILEKADIKKILSHCDERLTLEILLGVSGSMRIGEILSFTFDDLNLKTDPAEIRIKAENSKNGIARTVYISDEAAEAMDVWLKIRDRTLDITKKRSRGKIRDESIVIPYTDINERLRLITALGKAGYDEIDPVTRYHKVHFHSFRKYYLSKFGKDDVSKAAGEALAGHEGYLDFAYMRISREEIRQEYLKALPKLRVLTPDDYEELKYSRAVEIAGLQQTNSHLMAEIAVMKAALDNVQKEQERQAVSIISGFPRRLPHDDPDISDM